VPGFSFDDVVVTPCRRCHPRLAAADDGVVGEQPYAFAQQRVSTHLDFEDDPCGLVLAIYGAHRAMGSGPVFDQWGNIVDTPH
jgi:hypothetical protein